jgi:uncharacterized membrane protein
MTIRTSMTSLLPQLYLHMDIFIVVMQCNLANTVQLRHKIIFIYLMPTTLNKFFIDYT